MANVDYSALEEAIMPFVHSDDFVDYSTDCAPDAGKCKAHRQLLTAMYKATVGPRRPPTVPSIPTARFLPGTSLGNTPMYTH
jgi:hypothetical protein